MRDLWGKLFAVFFGIVGMADFLSITMVYKMSEPWRALALKAFPVEYWIIIFGEMLIAFAYVIVYFISSYNRGKTLALLAFLFFVFRLLSEVPLVGAEVKLTVRSLINPVIIYIGGMATVYNLSRD